MRAARYQLRFTPGVNLPPATYGGGLWGNATYGQRATDPITSLSYRLIPWPGGHLAEPGWLFRQGDTRPRFEAVISSPEGPIDLTGLNVAYLVLTDTDAALTHWMYELDVTVESGLQLLTRTFLRDDLMTPGTFRAGVVITYVSERRLSIPADDRNTFVVTPNTTLDFPASPNYRWDEAKWGFAIWS